jgi:ribonuclease J
MLHVSGHASQEELKLMLNLTRPRFFIPIHGEYRQLYHHALVAEMTGMSRDQILMAETGDIIALGEHSAEILGKAPVGRHFIDEGGIAALGRETGLCGGLSGAPAGRRSPDGRSADDPAIDGSRPGRGQ